MYKVYICDPAGLLYYFETNAAITFFRSNRIFN